MRTIKAIIKKEFKQVFRNKILSKILIIMPIVQLVLLVFAANFEIKNISLGVVDRDNSTASRNLINAIASSGYFELNDYSKSYKQSFKKIENDDIDVLIEIPIYFERDLYRGDTPNLSIIVNAINGMKAGVATSYLGAIIKNKTADFAQTNSLSTKQIPPSIYMEYSQWYNPHLDYKSLMLPGILTILITAIGLLITALNIVREKEEGTIEQLNVTPIHKLEFIIGKILPFGIIAMFQLTLGLIVSVVIFDLQILGSLPLLYGVVAVYMFVILGIGFFISTISETQSQAMFTTMFFMFIFVLLSGLFTPIESMPLWAQKVTLFNPTAYMIEIIREIVLKGSTFMDIWKDFAILGIFAVIINAAVILNYRKIN